MFRTRTVVVWATLCFGGFAAVVRAQAPAAGCSAIVARPNNEFGGANLSMFTPWGGKSGWTRDVSGDPVDPHSAVWVASIQPSPGRDPFLMADPVVKTVVVTGGQTRVEAPLTGYPTVSDPGPYPVPLPPIIQGVSGNNYKIEGDKHLTIIDKDNCLLYELYTALYDPKANTLSATSAAVYDLLSGDHQRPYLWTGGSVSGLPWSYNALRYDEVASGTIQHALTFAARLAWGRSGFTDMASSHQYTMPNLDNLPPFGARARLKANYDISRFSPNMQVVLKALKQYGMVYIDGSIPIDLHMEVDDRWDRSDLNQLRQVLFNNDNFEFIQTGPIYNDPMWGAATRPPAEAAPVISSFAADASSVRAGTPVTLTWSVSGAGSRIRIITPGVGPVVTDSVVVTPAVTTTYTLMVENAYAASKANVTVTVDAADCVPGAPALTISPAAQDISAGQAASFDVSVVNTDSSGCVAERFALSHTLPLGWTGGYSNPALTIAPGATATATLNVVAPTNGGARGDTPITAAVSGMSGTVSQTANVTFSPAQALSLALSASSVGGGKPATGTVKLVNPAPAGGAAIALSAAGEGATVPSSVTIPEGSNSATFRIATTPVAASSTAVISASYLDQTRTASLRVDPAALWFIGIAAKKVDGGLSVRGNNVFMTGASAADVTVAMTSSDPTVASPQPTVTIPAGSTQASFVISTSPVDKETTVKITATYAGVTYSESLIVRPAAPPAGPPPALSDMTLLPTSIAGGFSSAANTISLTAPAVADIAVALSSADPKVAVPAQVVIPAGRRSAMFTMSAASVDVAVDVAITASYGGATVVKTVTVVPANTPSGRSGGGPGSRSKPGR